MRAIKNIVIHCTATAPTATVESIRNYWRNVLGWKSPGYHYLIKSDGEIVNLQPIQSLANGVAGHNSNSIHVSYIGGVEGTRPMDTRTAQQKVSMLKIVKELKAKFPQAEIKGHRDFPGVNKACPSFDVKKWVQDEKLS